VDFVLNHAFQDIAAVRRNAREISPLVSTLNSHLSSLWCRESLGDLEIEFFGATLEQVKDGSQLISATEATTWIEFTPASKAAAGSLELAKSKVEQLAANAPGEYMIFSQTTGNKITIKPDGLPEPGAGSASLHQS